MPVNTGRNQFAYIQYALNTWALNVELEGFALAILCPLQGAVKSLTFGYTTVNVFFEELWPRLDSNQRPAETISVTTSSSAAALPTELLDQLVGRRLSATHFSYVAFARGLTEPI